MKGKGWVGEGNATSNSAISYSVSYTSYRVDSPWAGKICQLAGHFSRIDGLDWEGVCVFAWRGRGKGEQRVATSDLGLLTSSLLRLLVDRSRWGFLEATAESSVIFPHTPFSELQTASVGANRQETVWWVDRCIYLQHAKAPMAAAGGCKGKCVEKEKEKTLRSGSGRYLGAWVVIDREVAVGGTEFAWLNKIWWVCVLEKMQRLHRYMYSYVIMLSKLSFRGAWHKTRLVVGRQER